MAGPFYWPPRSLDLTPLVFLWGHVKTIAYATKPSYVKAIITNVISGITINQLANDFRELLNRIILCIANDGGHVET